MAKPIVHISQSLEELSEMAASRISQIINASPEINPFRVILAGGETPALLYRVLSNRFKDQLPWSRIHLFPGDERFVPLDDPGSNYAMISETLLSRVPIPAENVHPVPTELSSPQEAADQYEKVLRKFFKDDGPELTILGMGSDGHTASLFPDSEVLNERNRFVSAVEAPPYVTPASRITLTIPFLNRSRYILFLVSGARKSAALHTVLGDSESDQSPYPAGMVHARESTEWFVDEAAYGR